MDNNLKGNPSAINYGAGFKPRSLKPFPNYANSNKMAPVKRKKKKTAEKLPVRQKTNYGQTQGRYTTATITGKKKFS